MLDTAPSKSPECSALLSTARFLLRVRRGLRAGDWNEVEMRTSKPWYKFRGDMELRPAMQSVQKTN